MKNYIHVEDCDSCYHPYWQDELIEGLCVGCQEFKEEE
jgi:hypothetical protein